MQCLTQAQLRAVFRSQYQSKFACKYEITSPTFFQSDGKHQGEDRVSDGMSAAGGGLPHQQKETKQEVIKQVNLPTLLKPTDI